MAEILALAKRAAKQAGDAVLKRYFAKANKVSFKGDTSPVSQADKLANTMIIDAIREEFPDHIIVSEEARTTGKDSPYTWYIDPIDGTTNFIHGLPIWGVSVGVFKDGAPYAGAIYVPALKQLYAAQKGKGATLNGKRIFSRSPDDFANMAIDILGKRHPAIRARRIAYFAKLFKKRFLARFSGSSAFALCALASGRYGAVIITEDEPYDIAAGIIICQEAGAKVLTLRESGKFLQGDYAFCESDKTLKEIKRLLS